MPHLDDLRKKLYEHTGAEDAAKRMKWRVVFPKFRQESPSYWGEQGKMSGNPRYSLRKILLFFGFGGVLLFAAGAGVFIYLYLSTRGQEAEIAVQSRDSAAAGERVAVPIVFKNISRSPLKEVELAVVLPERSLVEEEGRDTAPPGRIIKKTEDLAPGEERTIQLDVKLFGREDEEKKIEATLLYRPENLSARFSSRVSKIITITTVPLALRWELPDAVRQNQEVEAVLHYISNAVYPFPDAAVKIEYPNGFTVASVDPKPDENSGIWAIGVLEPGKEGKIVIRGRLSGEAGERKSFTAGIGFFNDITRVWTPYADMAQETRLNASALFVQGSVDGARARTIMPGEQLRFSVQYRNTSSVAIRNVSVRAALDAIAGGGTVYEGANNLFDVRTLAVEKGGVMDAELQSVTWGPGGTPELKEIAPGAEGTLTFTVTARSNPVIRSPEEKNFSVRLRSFIESPVVPEELKGTDLSSEDEVIFKTATKTLFDGKAVFRSAVLPGHGPLPPRVGQKTTYTIVLEARNFTNDLSGAEARISLPPNVKWENAFSPSDLAFTFDKSSAQARWNIGVLAAGTGVLNPALKAAFQVSVSPANADVGKALTLVQSILFSGRDAVTDEVRTETIGQLTTELTSDPLTKATDWRVAR